MCVLGLLIFLEPFLPRPAVATIKRETDQEKFKKLLKVNENAKKKIEIKLIRLKYIVQTTSSWTTIEAATAAGASLLRKKTSN